MAVSEGSSGVGDWLAALSQDLDSPKNGERRGATRAADSKRAVGMHVILFQTREDVHSAIEGDHDRLLAK
jgi:hypothetical protein